MKLPCQNTTTAEKIPHFCTGSMPLPTKVITGIVCQDFYIDRNYGAF
jgi:hypothetical protein